MAPRVVPRALALSLTCIVATAAAAPRALALSISLLDGAYNVSVDGALWFVSGDTSVTLGGRTYSARAGTLALASSSQATGADGMGAFDSTSMSWAAGASSAAWVTEFRVYTARPAVRFLSTWPAGNGGGAAAAGGASATFPSLLAAPGAPKQLGTLAQDPRSANCGWTVFGAPYVTASGGLLVLAPPFDARAPARAAVGFAAASNIATVRQDLVPARRGVGAPLALTAGPSAELDLPAGYAMSTMLIAASSSGADPRAAGAAAWGLPPGGANAALLALGDALMALHGKTRPTPESAGPIYAGLGYSTTAFYFYNPCDGGRWPSGTSPPGRAHGMPGPCTTYEDTLVALRESLVSASALPPIHNVLLDSFWYGEGIFDGVTLWEDSPALMAQVQSFPRGLAAFASGFNASVALWAHNGAFTAASPYLADFPFTAGQIPQGEALWDHLFRANAAWRLRQIKQDHVGDYLRAAGVIHNASVMDAWMGGMAASAARNGVQIQYCCSPPPVLHAGAAYAAAVGARASPDYVANAHGGVRPLFQWAIGVESAFHWLGAGLLPDKDTTLTNSSSTQRGGDDAPAANAPSFYGYSEKNALKHLLAAALSGGPTSFSDAVGAANATLLRAVTRADGTVLRTSRTHTAIEAELSAIMFPGGWRGAGAARGHLPDALPRARPDATLPNGDLGEVSSSVTIVGARTWHVVTAAQLAAPLALFPGDLAIADAAAGGFVATAWDFSTFAPGAAARAFPLVLSPTGAEYAAAPSLVVLAPLVASGSASWALLGELGKAVPVSPQRVAAVDADGAGGLVVTVLGAPGEAVTLAACSVVSDVESGAWACDVVTATCPAPGAIAFPSRQCRAAAP